MSSEEEEFGPTVPPLSDYIRGILARYPDGSQILKELLQNAEDAGAREVKFLYDKRTWKKQKLFIPKLESCQGPALCVFNDAKFEKCDWKGIQEPQRSRKSDNVLKVGKFGIGFNSVYHITDMPWLLSGKKLVVMEPTEELLSIQIRSTVKRRSGFQWHLNNEKHQQEMLNAWDQFQPIENAAQIVHPQNVTFSSQRQYDGTLFRLPLRTKPSRKLSEVVYNDALVKKLFIDFAEDGAGLLLFLFKVESIEASIREKKGCTKLHVAVKISSEDSERVRLIKRDFSQKIKAIADSQNRKEKLLHSLTLNVDFGTEEIIINKTKQEKKWIVSHFLPSHSKAPRAWSIDVKRLPWVSLAAQVQVATDGRLFCFLPLPNNPEIVTGFPVHINAFFGVEDNRRNLKWSATDQSRDKDAQWNEALRDEVIPHAYVQLICYCRDQYGDASYSLWPQRGNLHERWKPLLEPFYKLLFKQSVLKVSSPSGKWIQFSDDMYVDILNKSFEPKVAEAVRRWLDIADTRYVNAPDHVIEGVEEYSRLVQCVIQYLTPEIVRNELLQKCPNWDSADEDRLLLLHYFVTSKKPSDECNVVAHLIQDFPLIPLLNGGFGSLHTFPSKAMFYLASQKHVELLEPLESCIINVSVLAEDDVQFLQGFADLNYGVEKINEKNFPALLRETLPDSWRNETNFNCDLNTKKSPNRIWLQKLWTLLRQDYPSDLAQFIGLTIVEFSQHNNYSNMVALPNQDKSLLFVQRVFLPNLEQLLIAGDAIPLPNAFMQQHPALQEYIHTGNTKSLITLLQNCNVQKLEKAINANITARKELVSHLAQFIHEIPPGGKNILSKLSLFEVMLWPKSSRHTSVVVSINNYPSSLAVNFDGLPANVQWDAPLLDCRSKEYATLARWLEIDFASKAQIADDVINKRNNYQANDFSNLMLWCIDHVKAWNVHSSLKDFPFVQCDDGNYHAPSTIYDQTVEELKIFFSGELGKFPSGEYLSAKALEFLRGLGLKTTTNAITAEEMMQTAIVIDKLGLSVRNKRICFIQVLQIHFNKLSKTELTQMKMLKLFQAKSDSPKDYPNNLPWFGTGKETTYYSAINMAQEDCASIIGSVMPVIGKSLPEALLNDFGFLLSKDIQTNLLVSQLKTISKHYQKMNVSNPIFQSMIHKLYSTMLEKDLNELKVNLSNQNMERWVWVCDEFVESTQVVTKWMSFTHGLEPYMYSLPNFLQEELLKGFFHNMGVQIDDGANLGRRILDNIISKHKEMSVDEVESKRDLSLIQSILEIIADDLYEDEEVQVPIKHDSHTLKFLPASQCKYDDSDNINNLGYEDEDEEEDLILVHIKLPNDLCRRLGATPLSNAVLDAEDFEQQESMLTRLKNILDEYPAGATIFQELIQNADDAEAKEIGFLIDMRENAQWRQSVLWRESGMDKFQGPALWVFNDAIFTEDDFKNILSVGGATKRSHSEKIGSFGVGFNSVYHLTDMPSFVSANFLAILDPHKFCVPNSAGIKINLLNKPKKLNAFRDQFSPYKDVFKCDLSYKREGITYPHTLFRLPLRDVEMASKSQLSGITHNMEHLLKKFAETRNYITLFLQHIHKLSFQHLERIHSSPLNAQQVLIIEKIVEPIASNLPAQEIFTKVVKRCLSKNQFKPLHQSSLVKVKVRNNNSVLNLGILDGNDTCGVSWIVQWNTNEGETLNLASSTEGRAAGLMPAVAVASCMKEYNNKLKVEPISGLVFCYLPLPVESGLPFHVHAPFALGSNRRHLWTENIRDETNLKTQWNEILKTEALVECLMKLLEVLKKFDEDNRLVDYEFYSLWPRQNYVKSEFSGFVASFYSQLCSVEKCFWKAENGQWIRFSHARFLLLSSQWSESFVQTAQEVLQVFLDLYLIGASFVLLSPDIQMTIESLFSDQLMAQSYTDETFFKTIFFPNLIKYDSELANLILLEILTENNARKPYLKTLLQGTCCIPASPDGERRLRPSDLVNVEGEISKLYMEEDGKFPYGQFREPEIRSKLLSLGMHKYPTGEMLVERAETVKTLVENGCIHEAKFRSCLILQNLVNDDDQIDDSLFDEFSDISFIFALQPDTNWFLPWFQTDEILFTPQEVFYKSNKNVICFVQPIWDDEGIRSSKTQKLAYHLRIGRTPKIEFVLSQLQILYQLDMTKYSKTQFDKVQSISADCLKLLQGFGLNESQVLLNKLKSINTIIIKSVGAVPCNIVSYQVLRENYTPYLHSIKDTPYEECMQLLKLCGVKDEFSISDYIDALKRMQEKYGTDKLPTPVLKIAIHIDTKLYELLRGLSEEEAENYKEELLVPDLNGILMPASKLIFWELDMKEIPHELMIDACFCHKGILRHVALTLGVSLQRKMIAELFSTQFFPDGEAFGQYENLTTRIKNILNEYSNKSDVISEMIQNADDAGATEIRFILDERQLPTNPNKLLSDNWKYLQGPALIVYNNKPFRTEDYDGIRDLGLGSKRDNPDLTGKFGIGFNTVYHLTDVPMFISNGEKLCALDPHCKYVPTAKATAPGGLFNITQHFKSIYSDVLSGFQPVEDLNFENSTVFRLPLRYVRQGLSSMIGDEIRVEELSKMLRDFEKNTKEYLLFLRNVEKIQITFVNKRGEILSDSVCCYEMCEADREKKDEFYRKISFNVQLDEDVVVAYRLQLFNRIDDNDYQYRQEWLILQRRSCMKHDVPPALRDLINEKVLVASPSVGIATPLYSTIVKSRLYTTLPLPGYTQFPVHINGKFILDSGRKHCYLHNDDSFKTKWNNYLIVKVLAPLYVQTIENVKNVLDIVWKRHNLKHEKFIEKYLSYFPLMSKLDPIPLLIMKQVYQDLQANNLKLLFGIKQSKDLRRELFWLSMNEGIMDSLSNSWNPSDCQNVQITAVDCLRNALEKLQFPNFHRGFNAVLTNVAENFDFTIKQLSPSLVAQHVKDLPDDKLIVTSTVQNLPTDIKNTILNEYDISRCLSYILQSRSNSLYQIPLVLTADDKLRRYSSNSELYKSSYSKLLPSQGEFFCSRKQNIHKLLEKFCQKLTVSLLAKYIAKELPHLNNVERVAEDQIDKLIWKILEFLADVEFPSHTTNHTNFLIQHIRPLENWALLPVYITDTKKRSCYLVPLKYAPLTVLKNLSHNKLYSVLENLGCMFTNVNQIFSKSSKNETFFKYLCVTTTKPSSVVNLLHNVCSNKVDGADFTRINEKEKWILFEYIINSYDEKNESSDFGMIKSLPLFQTIEGTFISLETYGSTTYISCDGSIEEAELDKLKSSKNIVFLTSRLARSEHFCKHLNIDVLDPVQVYIKHIIDFMNHFNLESLVKHLNWIKSNASKHQHTELFNQLGSKALIKTCSGQLRAIKDLYTSGIKNIFGTMMSEENFIPQSFWTVVQDVCGMGRCNLKAEWENFFKQLDLKEELCSDVFLKLAEDLEANEDSLSIEVVKQRSEILAKYLKSASELNDETFLQKLSTVKFIYAHNVPDELNKLYNQSEAFTSLICYQDSMVHDQELLCWSVCKLIPSWSKNRHAKSLGYYKIPTINHVVAHAENICQLLQPLKYGQLKTVGVNSQEAILSLHNVIDAIFKFLDKNVDELTDNLLEKMRNVPCILVEEGRKLICPSQVVTDSFVECPPFMYILPEEMFPFIKVLQKLGTERKIACHHYISALKMLHTISDDAPIKNPNIKNSLKNMYIGFLTQVIQLGPEKVTDEVLYLPDENCHMRKSTDILVCTENPEDLILSTEMPNHKWNILMIQGIDIPLIKCADALMRLPQIIRPISYQQFLSRELSNDCEVCKEDFCEHQHNIQRLFQNSRFIRVMVQLINSFEMHPDGNRAKQDEFSIFFKQIKVICYKELKVIRYNRANNESLGEQNVAIFWRKTQDNDNTIEFLVSHGVSDINESFSDNLLCLLQLICPMKTSLHESFMSSLFDYLDLSRQTNSLKNIQRRKLKQYEVKETYLPQLGSVLTEDLVALLDQNCWNHYKVFDYIACPITNLEENENVYVFGLIVKELEKSDKNKYVKWYLVDIGLAEPVEKSTLEIYKFLNVEEMEDEVKNTMQLQRHEFPGADETNTKFSRDFEDVLQEVSDQLENFWKLSLEDRGKAVRRLYLYWHPDKNPPDKSKYCEDVFKHIVKESDRLKKGTPRKRKPKKRKAEDDFPFSEWDNEARSNKKRKQNYYERAGSDWNYFSSSTRESGIPPAFAKSFNKTAKLWCEQAKFDLDEASRPNQCYEWVFYKYYQVARKSMIAMLFTKSTCENLNANLMELALNVALVFGSEHGDICNIVKLMIENGVDEVRTVNPRAGKTPHDFYQQYSARVSLVDESAKKLFEIAKETVERCQREN